MLTKGEKYVRRNTGISFGVAKEFGGVCNLRFDDTNPIAEKQDYIDNIKNDVKWLGFEWAGEAYHASSYFDQLHAWAIQLIEQGDAYVDLQTPASKRVSCSSTILVPRTR